MPALLISTAVTWGPCVSTKMSSAAGVPTFPAMSSAVTTISRKPSSANPLAEVGSFRFRTYDVVHDASVKTWSPSSGEAIARANSPGVAIESSDVESAYSLMIASASLVPVKDALVSEVIRSPTVAVTPSTPVSDPSPARPMMLIGGAIVSRVTCRGVENSPRPSTWGVAASRMRTAAVRKLLWPSCRSPVVVANSQRLLLSVPVDGPWNVAAPSSTPLLNTSTKKSVSATRSRFTYSSRRSSSR